MSSRQANTAFSCAENQLSQAENLDIRTDKKKSRFIDFIRMMVCLIALGGCGTQSPGCNGSFEQYLGKWKSRKPINHLGWQSNYRHVLIIKDWAPPANNGPKQIVQVGDQTATLMRTVDFIVTGFHHRGGVYELSDGDHVLITWCDLGGSCLNAVRREGDNLMLGRSKGQDCRKLVHPPYSWEELKPAEEPK